MDLIKKIKKNIPEKYKVKLRKALNMLIPGENISQSKNKWNKLASDNPRYIVLTDLGEGITEEEFKKTGEKDFNELVMRDSFLMEKLGNTKEKTVLEIGCGIGRTTEFLSHNFKKVYGVDISEKMIEVGKERLKNLTNASITANDGLTYPVQDSSIDFVFSYIVFQHMSSKKTVAKNLLEIKRVLVPNGIAKIQVRGLPTSKMNWFYGPSFTKEEIEKLLNSIGLKILRMDGENQRYFWLWLSK